MPLEFQYAKNDMIKLGIRIFINFLWYLGVCQFSQIVLSPMSELKKNRW